MGGLVMAWLVGEGIIIYRSVRLQRVPPGPGQLLLSSGVFVILALIAEAQQARQVATLAAWAFDLAAFMNIAAVTPPKGDKNCWPPRNASMDTVFPTQVGSAVPLAPTADNAPPPTTTYTV
jgi:hypothetical protein